jgi:hypothetical protein
MSPSRSISTQNELRQARSSVRFCYLCGQSVVAGEYDSALASVNKDHVPPKKIFSASDRVNPLILNTHYSCNHGWSLADSLFGELFALYNEREFTEEKPPILETQEFSHKATGEQFDAITGVDIKQLLCRILRGFHAALYGEFLGKGTEISISLQFPSVSFEDGIIAEGLHPMHSEVAWKLYNSRLSNNCDRVEIYNSKCKYICVWDKLDNGMVCCLFSISIYEWEKMVDLRLVPESCCVGLLMPKTGIPDGAAVVNGIELPRPLIPIYNPFRD